MFISSQPPIDSGSKASFPSTMNKEEADETHNYSYCSDQSSSPMPLNAKPSTRSLIDFWNNPHESGMTVSFSHFMKSSNGSSSSRSNKKMNSTINTLSYSGENDPSNSTLILTEMLLDVTCEDVQKENDDFDVTESTTDCPDESVVLHQYPINYDSELITEEHKINPETLYQVGIAYEPSDGVHSTTRPVLGKDSSPRIDQNNDTFNVEEKSETRITNNLCQDEPAQKMCNTSIPLHQESMPNINSHKNEYSATLCNISIPSYAGLPPLPPRPYKKTDTIQKSKSTSRGEYIAKVVENRLPEAPIHYTPFTDSSLSTIMVEKSFDAECNNNGVSILPSSSSSSLGPFLSRNAEMNPPHEDDDLDLTSIHSEDSDDDVPHNSRRHLVSVDSHHSMIMSDVDNDNIMKATSNMEEGDVAFNNSEVMDGNVNNARKHIMHVKGGNDMTQIADAKSPSTMSLIDEKEVEGNKSDSDLSKSKIEDICDFGSCRDQNRSNDTENMILNVIDAAEKSILQGQEIQASNHTSTYQYDPSMFFDCDEYDAVSQIHRTDIHSASLPLKFLTSSVPTSPLATIDDTKVYENGKLSAADINTATSPLTIPSEHLFTRITPVRSNSSRIEDGSNRSSTIESIAGPPLKIKKGGKKFLPRKTTSVTQRVNKEKKSNQKRHNEEKNSKRSIPIDDEVDDDELSSSVSTLDLDFEKDESSNMLWIDAFLDFVSPPEDSRSVESESTTSTTTGSNGLTVPIVDVSIANTNGSNREQYSKQLRNKRKPPTSLSRLREWWQKELIEEVLKGATAKATDDSIEDSFEHREPNDTVEKLVSKEFHKALRGKKIGLLGSDKEINGETKSSINAEPSDWLESLKRTIESATSTDFICGNTENAIVIEEETHRQKSSKPVTTYQTKSFDSLDNLVQELKRNNVGTDSTALRGHFQSMYEQLQQKLKDAHLFDQAYTAPPVTTNQEIRGSSVSSYTKSNTEVAPESVTKPNTESVEICDGSRQLVEALPDDSLQYLLRSNSPVYSPSTTDYLQPSAVTRISSKGKKEKSKIRVTMALAKAKSAIAQRRRIASLKKTVEDDNANKDPPVRKSLIELKEDPDDSVALADLDISMDEHAQMLDCDVGYVEDDVKVSFHDHSGGVAQFVTEKRDNQININSISELGESDTSNNQFPDTTIEGNDVIPAISFLSSNDGNIALGLDDHTDPPARDIVNKNNMTKDTVTDNSGTDESINLHFGSFVQRSAFSKERDVNSVCEIAEPSMDTTATSASGTAPVLGQVADTTVTNSHSELDNTQHYFPLDSSGETLTHFGRELALQINVDKISSNYIDKQYLELTSSEPSDDSVDLVTSSTLGHKSSSDKGSRRTSRFVRGTRSLNLRISSGAKIEDLTMKRNKSILKSKAFRRAESYVAMQPTSIVDFSICNSENAIDGVHTTDTEAATSTFQTKSEKNATRLARNASILSALKKKARGARKGRSAQNVFDSSLNESFTSPTEGKDSTNWEEFRSNPFDVNKRRMSTKAEI